MGINGLRVEEKMWLEARIAPTTHGFKGEYGNPSATSTLITRVENYTSGTAWNRYTVYDITWQYSGLAYS